MVLTILILILIFSPFQIQVQNGIRQTTTNEEKIKCSTYYEGEMSGSMVAEKIGINKNVVCKISRNPIAYSMQIIKGKTYLFLIELSEG